MARCGIGLVVGLFAPPLSVSTAIGAGIRALLGHFTKSTNSRVEAAFTKSAEKVGKAIDGDDYDKLRDAVERSEKRIDKAVDS